MQMIADLMLICGALGAAFYCLVLSRRLRKLTDLENGVGGAIRSLSAQVDEVSRAINEARAAAQTSAVTLEKATTRAESSARRLELLMASLHDLPEGEAGSGSSRTAPFVAPPRSAAPTPSPTQPRRATFSTSRDPRREATS